MRACALLAAVTLAFAAPEAAQQPLRLELLLKAEAVWQQPLDAALTSPPLSADGRILLALEGAVEARSAETGETLWRNEDLGGASISGEGLRRTGDDLQLGLSLAGDAPRFAILDLSSGEAIGSTPLPAPPSGHPIAWDESRRLDGAAWLVPLESGVVLVAGPQGRISARHELGAGPASAPGSVVGFPTAWVGDPAQLVTLEGARAGRHVETPRANAVAGEARWLAAPGEGRELRAWKCRERRNERLRCRRRWTQNLGGRVLGAPLVGEERVIAGSLDTYVYAFRPRNGHLLWRTNVGHRIGKSPLAWDDYLAVVGEGRAEIVFLDALDGRVVGRIEGGSTSRSETCTTRPARAGELLVAPILEAPGSGPTLKAWRISFEAPPPPAPAEGEGPAPDPAEASPAPSETT